MGSRFKRLPEDIDDLNRMLMNAFKAGCNHGYCVEHTLDVVEQEELGAKCYVGLISEDEMYEEWERIRLESRLK